MIKVRKNRSEMGSLERVIETLDPVYRALKESSIPVSASSIHSLSSLHRAVALQSLKYFGVFRDEVDSVDAFGFTPLHYAVKLEHLESVLDLLELGSNPGAAEYVNGYSCLHMACRHSNEAIVAALLRHGPTRANELSHNHGNCLNIAVRSCKYEIAKLLMPHADFNAVDGNKQTCLHYIASDMLVFNKLDLGVKFLLLFNNPNLETADKCGRRPLHFAAQCGNKDILDKLIKLGADVNSRDCKGRSPTHYAVCGLGVGVDSGIGSCIGSLLLAGADVSSPDNADITPLQLTRMLLQERTWRKGEKTAFEVASLQMKRYEDNKTATRLAESSAMELLAQHSKSSKNQPKKK